jgi:pectinesterase
MESHIKEEGWHNWGKTEAEESSFFAEFNSSGPGAKMDKRVKWAKRLTSEEVEDYVIEKILSGWVPFSGMK